nr:unnamed protein product [Callosobruchus chinensis]
MVDRYGHFGRFVH